MIQPKITIAVSILTIDFLNLKSELDRIKKAQISTIHFDVMDNHFVGNLSFGPKILNDISSYLEDTNIVIDCHLMVSIKQEIKIKDYLKPFINKKVNSITLHYEALTKNQLEEFLNWKDCNFKKGLAINPETEINKVFNYLKDLELILIMSVNPGFGNQEFITSSLQKIQSLTNFLKENNNQTIIAVDGGINDITAKKCIQSGANYLVSGSYLLNSSNSLEQQMKKLVSYEQ